jgi:hypothetical protein
VQGIVVHRTGSPTQNARAIRHYFNTSPDGRYASSQFVVDDQDILQLMPVGEIAFHTAGKNQTHLGIETCEHNWGTPAWGETYARLVWLVGWLLRNHNLSVQDVTGHFAWDPVNRPYDPAHPAWKPGDGKATGIFSWNAFIADVLTELERATSPPVLPPAPTLPEPIPVQVVGLDGQPRPCMPGRLIDSVTYVPIVDYTNCLLPQAEVAWNDAERSVTVQVAYESIAVRVAGPDGLPEPCEPGLLIGSTTYVPVRPFVSCLTPGADVAWDEAQRTVTIRPPAPAGEAPDSAGAT